MAGGSIVHPLHVWGSCLRLLGSPPCSFSSRIVWWEYSKRTCASVLVLIKSLPLLYLLCFTGQSKAYGHTESQCGSRLHKDVATRRGDSLGVLW